MRLAISALSLLLLPALSSFAADTLHLKDGDHIVFYGDSITDQRLYTVLTETYLVTRYPNLHLSFTHSGWGGDKVSGGGGGPIDLRLERDVFPYKPTVVSIMLGMNDGLYRAESEPTDHAYFDGMRHIVDSLQKNAPGVRITLIEPSPFDDVTRAPNFPGGYNEVLISFSKWLANLASEKSLETSDFNHPMTAMLAKADAADHEHALKIIPDRIHPGFAGHLVMAEQLITTWGGRTLVTEVDLDASSQTPSVRNSQYTAVSDLKSDSSGGLRWSELDQALPLPMPEWESGGNGDLVTLVLKSSDFMDTLDQQPLQVSGLRSGSYVLKIDGTPVGTFNDEEFAHGINLAALKTPMTEQAQKVYDLTVSHCDIHNQRWRTVQVPLAPYSLPEAKEDMTAADALEQAVLKLRAEAAQPKPHQFELTPVR